MIAEFSVKPDLLEKDWEDMLKVYWLGMHCRIADVACCNATISTMLAVAIACKIIQSAATHSPLTNFDPMVVKDDGAEHGGARASRGECIPIVYGMNLRQSRTTYPIGGIFANMPCAGQSVTLRV